jgi:hypothetical protein
MQDPASNSNVVQLYRICYKCKATGATGKASGVDIFEDAQKRLHEFNIRYADDFEYFIEPVNINGVEQEQLLKLVQEGKIAPSQLDQHG